MLAGDIDVVALGASAADPAAARRAGRHDPRSVFPLAHPGARAPRSAATIRRWPPRTRGAPTPSSRPSQYTAAADLERLGVAGDRIYVCPPGAPDWTTLGRAAERAVRRLRPVLRHARAAEERRRAARRLRAAAAQRRRRAPADRSPARDAAAARSLAATHRQRAAREPRRAHRLRRRRRARGAVSTARVLVLPSLDEGFGLPALEAMSAGVPVIVSSRGSLPEVVQDAGALVDPLDIDALAAAIERAAFDQNWAVSARAGGPRPGAPFHLDRIRSDAAPRVCGSDRTSSGTQRCSAGCPPPRHMKIAIDARELHDKPTGVGRLIRKLLDEWSGMSTAHAHEFISRSLRRAHTSTRGTTVGATGAACVWSERACARRPVRTGV